MLIYTYNNFLWIHVAYEPQLSLVLLSFNVSFQPYLCILHINFTFMNVKCFVLSFIHKFKSKFKVVSKLACIFVSFSLFVKNVCQLKAFHWYWMFINVTFMIPLRLNSSAIFLTLIN